jgi:hypothetical protein
MHLFSSSLVVALIAVVVVKCAPVVDSDKNDLQQLQIDQKINEIRQQLAKLQEEIGSQQTSQQNGPQVNAGSSKTDEAVDAERPPVDDPSVTYIDARTNRQIGWQPMRRLVAWQPMKKAASFAWQQSPSFAWQPLKRQQSQFDDASIREQMVQAVEQNLLEDLREGQKYGIEPQEILADLRLRNQHRYE